MKEHSDTSHRVEEVAAEIRVYMRLHPQAKDTLEGVARWWVGEEKTIVSNALDLLIRTGFCRKVSDLYCSPADG